MKVASIMMNFEVACTFHCNAWTRLLVKYKQNADDYSRKRVHYSKNFGAHPLRYKEMWHFMTYMARPRVKTSLNHRVYYTFLEEVWLSDEKRCTSQKFIIQVQ